jgi:hypothetical protein
VPQFEPGHHPATAPPPPPPRRETRNELKPVTAFRIPAGGTQFRHPRPAPVSNLHPDRTARRPNRDGDRLPGSPEPLCRTLFPKARSPARRPFPRMDGRDRATRPRTRGRPAPGPPARQASRSPGPPAQPSCTPPSRPPSSPGNHAGRTTHTGMHARLRRLRQARTTAKCGPSVAVRGNADGAHRPSELCTPTVRTVHTDRPNSTDARPLYVRGQRTTTVHSATR